MLLCKLIKVQTDIKLTYLAQSVSGCFLYFNNSMIFNVFRMNMDESSSILCHTDGSRAKFSHQKLAASRVVVLPVVVERSMELSKRDLWSFLDGH
jgi:hypothetical protein